MKILHLVSETNAHLTGWVYALRDKKEQKIEHTVLAFRKQGEKYFAVENGEVCSIDPKHCMAIADFIKYSSAFDKVIIHSMLFPSKMQLIILLCFPAFLKKLYWAEFGYDLYEIKKRKGVVGWVRWKIQMAFRKKIPNFISIFPPDEDFYKSLFGHKNRVFYAPYGQAEEVIDGVNTNLQFTHEPGKPYVIQVGHNASRILNHIEVLKRLSAYKNENILIYLTLAYGERLYAEEVKEYAVSIFGAEKVYIQDSMLSAEEYTERLKNIDIAVYDTPRQQALGNIGRLLKYNKKLYLMRDSVLYKFYSDMVPIGATDEIGVLPFGEFVKEVHSCTEEYMDFLRKRRGDFETGWDAVFHADNA